MAAQRAHRFPISTRYADADRRCLLDRKWWAIGPYADRNRWAWLVVDAPRHTATPRCHCQHFLHGHAGGWITHEGGDFSGSLSARVPSSARTCQEFLQRPLFPLTY